MSTEKQICKLSPCKSCPYRTDAKLRHWAKEEFQDLLTNDADLFGKLYGCHQQDGDICTGWIMDQDTRGFPALALRMFLSSKKITRQFLDRLFCKVPRFKSIREMAEANYPEIFKPKKHT